MPLAVGAILAVLVLGATTAAGMDRDRALYPAVTIVVASYYVLFAVLGGSMQALAMESAVAVAFAGLGLAAFRSTLWLAAAALAAHGVFDLFHGGLYANPGVPVWWPPFCMAFDVVAAAWLAALLATGRVPAAARQPGAAP